MKRILVALAALASITLAGACGGDSPTNQEQCKRYTELVRLAERSDESNYDYVTQKGRFCEAARRDRLEAKVDVSS